MKKIINRIRDVLFNHPRLFVIALLLVLLLVVMTLYRIADEYLNYSVTDTGKYYVYINDAKYEFEADIVKNRANEISKFDAKIDIDFDSLPIYSEDKTIFLKDMLVALPRESSLPYRILPYSYLRGNELVTTDYKEKLQHFFLYDRDNLYYFGESGKLIVDNEEYELSANSYVLCYSNIIEFYNYKFDEYQILEYTDRAIYSTSYYEIDLVNDRYTNNGAMLPKELKNLTLLSKKD